MQTTQFIKNIGGIDNFQGKSISKYKLPIVVTYDRPVRYYIVCFKVGLIMGYNIILPQDFSCLSWYKIKCGSTLLLHRVPVT